ncbi:MAG: translation initiation factor IF-2 [Gemmatimonadetes bacterium]|nr:translation initiation factor IF-2 [Gemmatimonadota bacterium]
MRVAELATDLGVSPKVLLSLLRTLRISATDNDASVSDGDVALILARLERERRSGHATRAEAIEAAIVDAKPTAGKRRRRRKSELPPEPEPEVEATEEADVAAVAAEADSDEASADAPRQAPDSDSDSGSVDVMDVADEVAPEVDIVAGTQSAPGDPEEPSARLEVESESQAEAETKAEAETGAPAAASPEPEAPPRKRPEPARQAGSEGPARVIRRPKPAGPSGTAGQVRVQAEGYTPDGQRSQRQRKGKKRQRVDQSAVQENIQRVMAQLKGGGKKRRRKGSAPSKEEREAAEEEARQEVERELKTVRVAEFLTVSELSDLVDVSSTELIGSAFKNLGLTITINQRLDFTQIELLLDEFGCTVIREEEYAHHEDTVEDHDAEEDLKPRSPVVTVMGHVDHGKTLLLDSIRESNVVAGESGGITQHIGAYHVELPGHRAITFLDTPGHSAFTAMRARGAEITDIVILVVAADDSVMPQTKEAISHARNAGVPLVVAVNKCDLPAADALKVKQELLQEDVQVEEFGGDVLSSDISAKTGEGIEELLEKVLLQADLLELKANPDRSAMGTVIESELDVGKGSVVTILVRKGTLRVGETFVVGNFEGRVRAMLDERGHKVAEALPGVPVQILGTAGVPQAGDTFQVMAAAKASEIAQSRMRLDREKQLRIKERGVKLGDFSGLVAEGKVEILPLIIKGDVDGSVQAFSDALENLGTDEVKVHIVHRAVGAINEEDVLLAGTSGAVILGFGVRPNTNARKNAERQGVDIRSYDVIYEGVEEIRSVLEGMLAPERIEHILGSAEVLEVFKIRKVGTIAGSQVIDGVVDRKAGVRLIREGIVVYEGEVSSLKRFKDDVGEVREGLECGIGIANFNDIKVGDVIESYTVEEVARTLAAATV